MMKQLTVVTLGTGGRDDLTRRVEKALREADTLILRTERHPVAAWLRSEGVAFDMLDHLYESCEDFDEFNQKAAKQLLKLCANGPVCYAVSDAAFDATVAAVRKAAQEAKAPFTVLPGVSHAARCLALVDAETFAVRLYAASEFDRAPHSPEEPLLLTELHSRACAGDCKLKLMDLLPEETMLTFITGDEETGELTAKAVPLYELDRQKNYDHLTAAYVPGVSYLQRSRYNMDDLVQVVTRLRAPDGCPWDREQTHESILPDLLEESYEYIQAVREEDIDHMYDELGDVLLQVAMQSEIAREHGEFELTDVTSAICGKMIERHPHVFGQVKADTSEQVLENWEALKRQQRGITSHADAMANVSTGLSPLLRASKVQKKAAKVGFDFDSPEEALKKVYEEADEVKENLRNGIDPEEEIGDLFFSVVNVCRLCGKNPDIALFSAVEKFISRFRGMEMQVKNAGKCVEDLTLSEMDVYWEAGKQNS